MYLRNTAVGVCISRSQASKVQTHCQRNEKLAHRATIDRLRNTLVIKTPAYIPLLLACKLTGIMTICLNGDISLDLQLARYPLKNICVSGSSGVVYGDARIAVTWANPVEDSGPVWLRKYCCVGVIGLSSGSSRTVKFIPYDTWLCKFSPTPGRCCTRGILKDLRCSFGPIPDSNKSCGEFTAPPETITSRVAHTVWIRPFYKILITMLLR